MPCKLKRVHLGLLPSAKICEFEPLLQILCTICLEQGEIGCEQAPSQECGKRKIGERGVGIETSRVCPLGHALLVLLAYSIRARFARNFNF